MSPDRRPLSRCAALAVACALPLLGACGEQRQAAQPARVLEVSVVGDRVSVHAQRAPIRDVLERIANQSALQLKLPATLDEQVTVELEDMPLESALRRILRQHSFALQRDATGGGRLWVFPQTGPQPPTGASVDPSMAPSATERWTRLALNDRAAAVRAEALFQLAESAADRRLSAGTREVLRQALTDPVLSVRRAALATLADQRGDDRAAQIAAAGLADASRGLRLASIDALESIGGPEACRILGVATQSDERAVRLAALEALEELRAANRPN